MTSIHSSPHHRCRPRPIRLPALAAVGIAAVVSNPGCITSDATEDRAAVLSRVAERLPLVTEDALAADPAASPAAWSPGDSLDADRAVAIAFERDATVRRALEAINRARAELADEDRAPNPMIELNLGVPIDGNAGAPSMGMLAQQVTWLWTRPGRLEAADARRRATMFEAATALVALDAEIRRVHARAINARRLADIAAELATTASAARRLLERRFEEGESTRVEVDVAMIEANRLVLEATAAEETARERTLELLAAIGLPDADPSGIDLATDSTPPSADQVPSESITLGLATTARFDVAAAGCLLEAARADAGLAGLERLPQVTASLMWSRNFMDREAVLPGLGVTLPIFHDGKPKIAAAAAAYRIAALDLLAIQRNAIAEARTARSRWLRSAVLANGLSTQVVAPAIESERLGEARRREGVGDEAATLSLRAVRLRSERALADQVLAAELARLDLLEAVGGDLAASPVIPFDAETGTAATSGRPDESPALETSA